jgi:hypothetical protein
VNLESDSVRPEVAAFRELEVVVRRATRELAGYRRRGSSDADALEIPHERVEMPDFTPFDLERRLAALEQENAVLRERLDAASARTRHMLERLQFLRQQTQVGGER